MSFKSRVNHLRRGLTKSLTAAVVAVLFPKGKEAPKNKEVYRILIVRPNSRLGNQLMLSPLIEELVRLFPKTTIDLFVRGGIAHVLYGHHPNIDGIFKLPGKPFKELGNYFMVWRKIRSKKYDWVINVDYDSSSGRIATLIARSDYRLLGEPSAPLKNRFEDYVHMAKQPVYNIWQSLGFSEEDMVKREIPHFNIRLSAEEMEQGQKNLMALSQNNTKVIGVFTYATGSKIINKKWWKECLSLLNTHFPNHSIIEFLPKENVSQLDFAVPNFNSNDLRGITSMMRHCDFIIAADSGMMHLASASGQPTVGLFSVTLASKYGPYNEKSFVFNPDKEPIAHLFEKIKSPCE